MSYRFSLLVLLTLFACSQKSLEDAPQSYPLETARMVSHVSEGLLASTDPIRVRLCRLLSVKVRLARCCERACFDLFLLLTVWRHGKTCVRLFLSQTRR